MKLCPNQKSDLGSPETENLEIETNEQSKNDEPPVKQDAEKKSTE